MKKKRLLIAGLCMMVAVGVVGCGNTAEKNAGSAAEEVYYADEDFMNSLSKGLEARWDITENSTEDYELGSDEEKEEYTKCINAELDELQHYKDEKFEDNKLQEAAISYINYLEDSKEALDYLTVDYEKYSELWDEAYNGRSELIAEFFNTYDLTVSEKYESILKDFLTNANLVQEKKSQEKAIKKMVKSIKFELEENDYGFKTYKAVIENNTGMDIKTISFDINLLDEDDIIIDSQYDSIENWADGKKAKIEFGTDQDFTSTEVTVDYWEAE